VLTTSPGLFKPPKPFGELGGFTINLK